MKKIYFVLAAMFFPFVASAHGVGQVYALPIPLKYYLGAAGLAVAFSFFIFAYFLSSQKSETPSEKRLKLAWLSPVLDVLRFLVFIFFLLAILTGVFGVNNANHNFAPIFFWVFFILGFGIASLVVGNIWDKVNPWKYLASFFGIKKGARHVSPWVGVVLVLGLYWFELSSGVSFLPTAVGGFLLIYTILNLLFYSQFENWFQDGELFSVLFGFIGKLAYFRISNDNRQLVIQPLRLRLAGKSMRWSDVGLAMVLLAGTSFDSFKETLTWFGFIRSLGLSNGASLILPNTLGLILFPLPFIAIYLLLMWLMEKMTKVSDWKTLSLEFVPALIPIAFGYTLAHNFSLVIVTIPQVVGLLSDPFGFGWNLLHTSQLATYNLVLGAKPIWFIEIGFVVVAHIVGTFFAHILAVRIMPNIKKVIVSQYPTLILMVVFTVTTLWLLSQPLVIAK